MGSKGETGGRRRARSAPVDVQRRLFELSLGNLRLLDTSLEKDGLPELATLLRDLVMSWRAYPSRSVFSREGLRGFAKNLEKIMAGLRTAGQPLEAEFVLGVMQEVKRGIRASK